MQTLLQFFAAIRPACIKLLLFPCCTIVFSAWQPGPPGKIKVGLFETNVTPPLGSPVAFAKTRSIADSLSARGLVIFINDEKPVVLCAVDWIGIANESQDEWRRQLAQAANTIVERVSVHALHQHDGVHSDFTMAAILQEYGITETPFDTAFQRNAIRRVALDVAWAATHTQPVTHIGFGEAKVEKVASNRRILGKDGKVAIVRWSKTTDTAAIAAAEGLIDPWLKSVSLWNKEKPLAALTYYATHPQSYYGDGDVTCEFIGIARNARQKTMGFPHIHFNGAGGNITAGKYNDGSPERRPILADRVEKAMREAWENTVKKKLSAESVKWTSLPVTLPIGKNIVEKDLRATLSNPPASRSSIMAAAEKLAWLQRWREGAKIAVSSLKLGKIWLLNLPGELFVEYQLAAQKMKPDGKVCTAAYEEYGPGYIGDAASYQQGGYETSDLSSGVDPSAEKILLRAINEALK